MARTERVPPKLLCVGDLNADIAITPAGHIVAGGDTPGSVRLTGGGSASNVAAEAARLGVATRFAGVVGDDVLGRVLVDELAGRGVDVRAVVRAGASSRSIAALIDGDGDRSMVSDLATSTVLMPADVDADWFDDTSWLHLTAYTWFPDDGPVVWSRLLGHATDRVMPWSVDPSSARMLTDRRGPDAAAAAFEGAAVVFPSHDEATVLTGDDDPALAAQRLLAVADTAAVTSGERGVTVARRGHETFTVAAHPATVVNALGCGDAFAAGFIAGRLRGLDDRACTDTASASAARVLAMSAAR